jgi:hypothetical protein
VVLRAAIYNDATIDWHYPMGLTTMTRFSLKFVLRATRHSLLVALLMLAACVPAAAPTPTPAVSGDLPFTASSQDGSLSVNYPEGWITQNSPGEVRLASSADVLENTDAASVQGVALAILALPSEILPTMAISAQTTLSDPPTVTEILGVYRVFALTDAQATVGDVTTLTIDGRNAARAPLILANGLDGEVTVLSLGDGDFVAISVGAGTGFLAPNRALIDQIIETISYTPPDLSGTPSPAG